MRFTIPVLVTVDVVDLGALLIAAAHCASARDRASTEPTLPMSGTSAEAATAALTELTYAPAIIDGYPGINVTSSFVGAVLPHPES